jgi:hypothetical protein
MKSILVAALGLSFACASMMSSAGPAGTAAASCSPATANPGATVYSRPDTTSNPVAALADRTQVCADSEVVGFGFRHVKLSNGKEGYVAAEDLI